MLHGYCCAHRQLTLQQQQTNLHTVSDGIAIASRLAHLVACTCCLFGSQDVAGECGVRAMPTFQAFFNGAKVDELTGADPGRLQAMIAK